MSIADDIIERLMAGGMVKSEARTLVASLMTEKRQQALRWAARHLREQTLPDYLDADFRHGVYFAAQLIDPDRKEASDVG